MLDLRIPSGWFFLVVGVILVVLGVVSPESHAPLTTVNVNLFTGIFMAAFGAFMLLLARRAARGARAGRLP